MDNYDQELNRLREIFLQKQTVTKKKIVDSAGIKRHKNEENAEQFSNFVKKDTETYCRDMSMNEPAIQRRLRDFTNTLPMGFMISCPLTSALIKMFVGLTNAKKCIDIGVFTGSSALCMALAIPQDGCVTAMEYNEDISKVAEIFWKLGGVREKVDLRIGAANDTLDEILKEEKEYGTYGFGFVDADKVNYKNYHEKCLKLLQPNGILVYDNTLWKGRVYQEGFENDASAVALREFNKYLHQDERVEVLILPISDGVTIVRKK